MPKNELAVEDKYKHLTDLEHILVRPDMYVGTVDTNTVNMWILNNETKKFTKSEILFSPALYKIFDEILVNARDHAVRNPKTCKNIRVNINKEEGRISVYNDGPGIEVKKHKDFGTYVPEMIFGHLRTSSNYEEKGKIVGGKNGFGAKLTNIFSKEFIIETVDSNESKFYRQVFNDNMSKKSVPIIKNNSGKSYTMISFIPDYDRFGFKKLTNEMIALFSKRVYDIAACTDKSVNVYLNDELIEIKTFDDYIKLYYETPQKIIYSEFGKRWKVGVIYDNSCGFQQISFVNGINTYNGGTHVSYVVNQICEKIAGVILKKNKDLKLKPDQIKTNLSVFIDCSIEDPTFNSQVKDKLTTKLSAFGSTCDVDDDFITKLSKTGIVDEVISYAQFRENKELKKTDGKKTGKLRHIEKLEDALYAGTANSHKCTLILVEGDSAKAFAMSGLKVIGDEYYGVFPLRGKLINVRGATPDKLIKNHEFKAIKEILGLKQNAIYKSTKELRYGRVMIITDQDNDGFHIKGLLINMISHYWPDLMLLDDFFQGLPTPLVKVYKKIDKKQIEPSIFYALSKYEKWSEEHQNELSKWTKPKYYKGLGTSTKEEAQEAFIDMHKRLINYTCDDVPADENSDDEENKSDEERGLSKQDAKKLKKANELLSLAFDKKRADDRKLWLGQYDFNAVLEATGKVPLSDFINKELIHFSNADNIRSIPSINDGLKPSLRKILFAMFKRGINAPEIKVSQLSGYVSSETEYHHGEASLVEAIVGMAQNFTGSNNINYLMPNGNFGTRMQNGHDHASARYIFTSLNSLMTKIFRTDDLPILEFIVEEGKEVEPKTYEPILPMILVNGAIGIGTGYSTNIPPFNPKDVVKALKCCIEEKDTHKIHPYFRGFTGTIEKESSSRYIMKGKYEIVNDETVKIVEIPVTTSGEAYKKILATLEIDEKNSKNDDEKKKSQKKIVNFRMSQDTKKNESYNISVTFKPTELQKLLKKNELEDYLKLKTSISLTNMHMYNSKNKLVKYDTVDDIIEDFYVHRLEIYKKRKEYKIQELENDVNIATYKMKYINDIINKKIIIQKQKQSDVLAKLEELKYPKLSRNVRSLDKSYSYLIDMSIWSLTFEKMEELQKEVDEMTAILDEYKSKSVEEIWIKELDDFLVAYDKWLIELDEIAERSEKARGKSKNKGKEKQGKIMRKSRK